MGRWVNARWRRLEFSRQQGCLDSQARPEGDRHARPGGSDLPHSIENKEDRRRRHVAVIGQDLVRGLEELTIEAGGFLERQQDARAAGMDRPGTHGGDG